MLWKNFIKDEDGVVSMEYVVFVAFIGVVLGVGVMALFGAMSEYFGNWAEFFAGAS